METNKILLGDCYELIKQIPDKSVDLVIIDPPYEIDTEGSKENNISKTFSGMNEELKGISCGIDNAILVQFMRVMKKPNIYIWCNKKQLFQYMSFFFGEGITAFEVMVWCKTNPTPLCGGNYLPDKEFCLYFRDGVKLNTSFETAWTFWVGSKNTFDREQYSHPTCKPIGIIKTLILNSSNEGDTVLDCFSGSGTTCVAAKELGRRFIGMEIDPRYHKISIDRLNGINSNGQTSIFTDFEKFDKSDYITTK